MDKAQSRRSMKVKLSLIDPNELEKKSSLLSKNLAQLLNEINVIQEKMIIGAFAPIENEALWFLELSTEYQKLTAYPFFNSKTKMMSFKKSVLSELVMERDFGVDILGPRKESPEEIPQVILIPGLAMGPGGERLGRGRGFYDKYLSDFYGVKIGICFSMQIQEGLPIEEHDVLLDYIVTEEKIIKCK